MWTRGGRLLGGRYGWGCTRERVVGRGVGVLPQVKLPGPAEEMVPGCSKLLTDIREAMADGSRHGSNAYDRFVV